MRHGTTSAYANHRCRCDECRAANTAYNIAYRHRTGRNKPRAVYLAECRDKPIQHGTETGYKRCKCDRCRAAATAARRHRRIA